MAAKSKKPRSLSQSEWDVMKVIWDIGPTAIRDIYAELSQKHNWAYTTVKTLVRRMAHKGWVGHKRVGNSFLYWAAVPRGKAVRAAVKDFSKRVLEGALSPFVAYYVAENDLTSEDIAQLEDIIEQHRKSGGKRR